jgi:glycosyltransferase involved in cell wall biosynthesis
VADEPAEFAEQIARLFANEPLRRRVSLDGRRYVEREHVWARVVDRLETLYVKLLGATDTHVPPPRSTAGSVAW